MRKRLAMTTALLTLALVATSTAQARTSTTTWHQRTVNHLRHKINVTRTLTWHYQDMAGHTRTRTVHAERRTQSVPFLRWIRQLWMHRKVAARRVLIGTAVTHTLHTSLWLCIHSREAGDWHNADTGHNGHYGGLQMTSPWGTGAYYVYRADLLSPSQQMWKAELGYRASGYSRTWLMGQWYHPECLGYA